ncbi:restriction endonuclease subunit S [Rhodococcus erythropolis]|uniref:restriction endonuclease subunit S n=1 Tax=Rhodococcus erythropolis TaxID=1833 RepID=UPI00083FAC1D|nr:restriction endonuclease subunit S [Rhodococcus erythropolis]
MTGNKRYEEYKDSGIEWARTIPMEWEKCPLFALVRVNTESNKTGTESNLLSLSYGRIIRKDITANDGLLPASFNTYQVIQQNDIVLRLTDLQNDKRSLRSAISPERGIITSAYLAVTPTGILPNFLSYLLRAYDLQKVFYAMGGGLRQSMKFSDIKWLPVVLPPESTQQAIVDFLDQETSQINELIGKQEQLVELLAEKRQAIINRAVTKGLDPTSLTKPSGDPWIGNVPEHWSLLALKNCSQVKRGRFMHRPRNAPHLYGGKYPFIQTGAIARAQGKYITEYSQTLSEAGLETSALMPQGTLVMAIAANIADVAILSFDSCAPDSVLGFRPTDRTNPDFLYYALTAKRAELISEAPVTSQGNLNVERVGGVTIPLPPLRDQQDIVKMLDYELEKMAQISSKASSVLRLLNERRSALVSAAVTGKIDVS